ncbi:MAG: TonB-dependent receptor [Novosphingobium sp.]
MNIRKFLTTSSAIGLAAAALPAAAFAQSAEEGGSPSDEIIVTAQRRAEASRDVPISVTTLNQTQLTTANVNALSDTAKLTPGLRFDTQGPAMQPTIRGVGTAITTSGGGPNVGIYVDGFFQANTYAADFQLMRVQNIQVLKGPQGTLFGRNTTGGAILVTTADPSTETGAEFKVSYGRFNAVTAQAYATVGLGENVAFDVEGLYRRGDGFQRNVLNGDRHIGAFENWSVRLGLKVDISPDVSVLLRYAHTEIDDPMTQLVNAYVDTSGDAGFLAKLTPAGRTAYGLSSSKGLPLVHLYFAPPGAYATAPGEIALNDPLSFKSKSDIVTGTIKADLGFANLTSYTQYRRDKSPYYGDLDATATQLFNILVDPDDETVSQEFVLNSKAGSRLQWTAGLNYFQVRDTWGVYAAFVPGPFSSFGGSTTTTKSIAAFADLTYELVPDKFFVTVGARYSHDSVSDATFTTNFGTVSYEGPDGQGICVTGGPYPACGAPAPGTVIPVATLNNNSVTPRVVLRYKPSGESSIYASYTRGYKAGILNVGGLSQKPVEPENIDAFELGYKYDNRTFSIDLAGFYYNYKNLQVSSFQNGAAQIRNAASSKIYGLEGQFRYRVSDAFSIYGGASWTHARYKSFTNAPYYTYCDPTAAAGTALYCTPLPAGYGPGALTQTTTDASGYKMQRAPEFTANLGASYGFAMAGGKLTLSGNLYYTSSFYFDPSQQFRQDGYATLSLRAEWKDASERYTIAAFGDNVTDKRYQTQVLFNTLGIGSVWSAPATWGVQLGAKF